MHVISDLRRRIQQLLPQLTKFGVVGMFGLVADVGVFNLLRYAGGEGPLHEYPVTAKLVSAALATVVSWLGHRYWTFADTRRDAVHHEFALFVVMCTLGTAIAAGCLAVSHYLLGFTSALADNVSANVIGLALGTTFRYWAYRVYVFRQPAQSHEEPSEERTPVNVPV